MRSQEDKSFAILRILFGCVWAIDAYFKWQPEFLNNFTDYLTEGAQGHGVLVQHWISFWVNTVSVDPHFFGVIVALAETAIAIGLLFGLFTKIALSGGIAMALVIWSTAEGFGGPYVAGSTDIGAAIIYVIVLIALLLGKCWRHYSLDARMKDAAPRLFGRW